MEFDLNQSFGIHAFIDNVVNFVSGGVGTSPAFKEPEENMSSNPQAIIIAMEQQQMRSEVSSRYSCLLFIELNTSAIIMNMPHRFTRILN